MSLYTILQQAHSGWRYIVLLLLVVVIVKYVMGWLQKGQWTKLDRQLGLFTTIAVDIQLLLGVILWAMLASDGLLSSIGRIIAMEHPTIMLVAVVVMHIGWSRARGASVDTIKFRNGAITFIVTGLLVALGVALITGFI